MKITDVKVHVLAKKCETMVCVSRGSSGYRFHAIVEVETDEGISGLGEGIGNVTLVRSIIETKLRGAAIGLDPFNIATIYEKLARGGTYWEHKGSVVCAASAIERDGFWVGIPESPGLGVKLSEEVREKYEVKPGQPMPGAKGLFA